MNYSPPNKLGSGFLRPSPKRPFAQSIAEQESKIVGTALHKPKSLRHPVREYKEEELYKPFLFYLLNENTCIHRLT